MDSNLPIGLDRAAATTLSTGLNQLLADLHIFYQNARGFHWNIRGRNFFELHLKFEELYNDLILKIDEVAERILTLDAKPLHAFEDYLKHSDVPVVRDVTDGTEAVKHCIAAFSVLLLRERALLRIASEANDEGTSALMSDYIREQEKLVWMYQAYLG